MSIFVKLNVCIFILWSNTSFFCLSAEAEYRVFILEITNSKTNQRQQIQSTLDPVQYASIYPLKPNESIMYQDTWLCRGNTAQYKQHCARPPVPSGR